MSEVPADFTARLCLAYDMRAYSRADEPRQVEVQQELDALLGAAAAAAGLDRTIWDRQPQGDGEVAVIPISVAQVRALLDRCLPELAASLLVYNIHRVETERITLRVAVGHGLVGNAALGFASNAVIEAGRLLDSAPVRAVLELDHTINLVVVLTDAVYRDYVKAGHTRSRPELLRQISIRAPKKNFYGRAWLWVPGRDVTRLTRTRLSGWTIAAAAAVITALLFATTAALWRQADGLVGGVSSSGSSSTAPNVVVLVGGDHLNVVHMVTGTALEDANLEVHPRYRVSDAFQVSPWGTAKLAKSTLTAEPAIRQACDRILAQRNDDNVVLTAHGPADGGDLGVGNWMCLRVDATTTAGIRLIRLDPSLPGAIELAVSLWRS